MISDLAYTNRGFYTSNLRQIQVYILVRPGSH